MRRRKKDMTITYMIALVFIFIFCMAIGMGIGKLIWPDAAGAFERPIDPSPEVKTLEVETPRKDLTTKAEIEAYIKKKFGKDGERALKIAKCESGLRVEAWGHNTNKTLDRGVFQLNSIHKNISNECAFNAKCNIDAAYQLYKSQGFTPWVCNRKV